HLDVETNDADLAERLTRHLPPGWRRSASYAGSRRYTVMLEDADRGGVRASLYVNGVPLARRSTVQTVLGAFGSDVALHVAEMAPDRVFVHAGVVGYQGRAILLPGRSFSGKTTLVVELVRAGAEYYSDEYAVLDTSGGVHPYSGPLSIRRPGEAPAKYPV